MPASPPTLPACSLPAAERRLAQSGQEKAAFDHTNARILTQIAGRTGRTGLARPNAPGRAGARPLRSGRFDHSI